ncbi:hypothetical protein KSP40_PGU005345 [Platanthera guangdongensis]|uniref:Uncharacterized protein n=1 Tax=Platanthera guangdongensis TaxID=2320717 RepID=A0ABR2M9D4_9ASPA
MEAAQFWATSPLNGAPTRGLTAIWPLALAIKRPPEGRLTWEALPPSGGRHGNGQSGGHLPHATKMMPRSSGTSIDLRIFDQIESIVPAETSQSPGVWEKQRSPFHDGRQGRARAAPFGKNGEDPFTKADGAEPAAQRLVNQLASLLRRSVGTGANRPFSRWSCEYQPPLRPAVWDTCCAHFSLVTRVPPGRFSAGGPASTGGGMYARIPNPSKIASLDLHLMSPYATPMAYSPMYAPDAVYAHPSMTQVAVN